MENKLICHPSKSMPIIFMIFHKKNSGKHWENKRIKGYKIIQVIINIRLERSLHIDRY